MAKKPTDISVVLENYLKGPEFGMHSGYLILSKNFEELVGKALLPHVSLLSLENSVLYLKVASSVWKSELFLQKKAIITKCNQFMNAPIVKDIRFT